MRVVAIAAHPDDIEIACAGTLLKCKQRGDEIFMVVAANGNMGHKIILPDELAKIRKAELESSAKICGAQLYTLDIDDLNVFDEKRQRDRLVAVLKEIQPDFIITHSPNDYMPDHVAVSKMVFGASFTSTLDHYAPEEKPATKLVPVAYMDTLAGNGFVPTEYVDIAAQIETKLNMLACHESQLKWMRDHDKIDFSEFVRTACRLRGLQCGAPFAEGFTMCNVWGRAATRRYLP